MEIKKITHIFVLVFLALSCGKSAVPEQIDKTVLTTVKQLSNEYQQIPYAKKSLLEGGVHVFQFKGNKVTIEYTNATLFGIGNEQTFNTYKSSYDLDLGEVDLLRFDANDSQIYLAELREGWDFIYNVYLFTADKMYYLGNLDINVSTIKSGDRQGKNTFSFLRSSDTVQVTVRNGKEQVTKSFMLANPLQPYKSYNGFQEYLEKNSADDSVSKAIANDYTSNLFQLSVSDNQVIARVKGENSTYINDDILAGYSSCPDVTLDKIVIKDPYFTIEKYNCTTSYYLKEYLTFKYDKKLLLHKYSVEYTSRKDPDEAIKTDHFSDKDFKIVRFEDVNKEFLNDLRQK